MTSELQQVLDSIAEFKTELKLEIKDSETRLEAKIDAYKMDVKLFNTKFDYYQQATQWVIILAFTLILAATAITIFSSVFAFR
ncbi:hypothetical protein [Chamaesiphon sp. OTE_8_metabat_110]|uniref:hypothetical protein n=1 Tax=Chamaesiphon sp. OTE_8_metabat_110 TaxID=2964696 RepID=UPI00286BDF5D|nr:hypothetical protein [Chamaesiphon sp. OTE_8_metabat_110]